VSPIIERYSFVAVTTQDLARARAFWVDGLGFTITEEQAGDFFIVDAGGLRLCVDAADGDVHVAGGSDPVIGLKIASVADALATLAARGIHSDGPATSRARGMHVRLRDPDGRTIILTEAD
jgi:catechol 2,3-dioxygenase-like lactoylglutathione lyase family enzyme